MGRPKKKPKPVYTLRAEILSAWPSYYIAHNDGQGLLDETSLRLSCAVAEVSAKFGQHIGEAIEITMTCERKLWLGGDDKDANQPYFLPLTLRKDRRSVMVYSPIDTIWALPALIASGSITHVEVDFDEPSRGVASTLAFSFSRLQDMREADIHMGRGLISTS